MRYGFWRIYVLIRRDGWQVNHKRVYRLYKEEGLNLRCRRPRRRKAAAHRTERPILTMINQAWSMDFVADALFDGRKFRALALVDNFSRECLGILVDQSLKADHVVGLLSEVVRQRGQPIRIQADNVLNASGHPFYGNSYPHRFANVCRCHVSARNILTSGLPRSCQEPCLTIVDTRFSACGVIFTVPKTA